MLGFRTFKDFTHTLINTDLLNIQILSGGLFAIINSFTGSYIWEKPYQIYFLVFLVIADVVTGVMAATKNRIFSSRRLPRFVMTLCAYICILAITKFIESNISFLGGYIGNLFYSSFVITQFVSLLENMGKLEIPGLSQITQIRNLILSKAESALGVSFKDMKKDAELKVLTSMVEYTKKVDADYIQLIRWEREGGSEGRYVYNPKTVLIYSKTEYSNFSVDVSNRQVSKDLFNMGIRNYNINKELSWMQHRGIGSLMTMRVDIDNVSEIDPFLIIGWRGNINENIDKSILEDKNFIENVKLLSK